MQFVIELYKLACATAEREVVCRGWKGKRRSQLGLPSNPSRAVGDRAAPRTKSEQRYF
jgi:hypothetical protein